MGGENQPDVHAVQNPLEFFSPQPFVVALGDVDELEVHRERPHDPAQLGRAGRLDSPLEPLLERGIVVRVEPLAQ